MALPGEADTESEALEKFVNGEHGEAVGPVIDKPMKGHGLMQAIARVCITMSA